MNNTHTAYDVMKEYLITGAELDGLYQIPMLPKSDAVPGKGIDFVSSKARSLKGHKDLTVNFYIDDKSFFAGMESTGSVYRTPEMFPFCLQPRFHNCFRDAKCVEHLQPVQKPCFRLLLGGYGC